MVARGRQRVCGCLFVAVTVSMAGYNQPGGKRQKVREVRPGDNVDYFQGIDKIEYNNMSSPSDVSSYRFYNSTERVHSRAMEDWLKFSVSLTEFRNNGSDNHRPPHTHPWNDGSNTLENYKRCIRALFEFCQKLGVKYWTALDSDLLHCEWWDDPKQWDDIVEYVQELSQRYHVKLLWLAPDLHSHARYAYGAFTSNEAFTFAQAAAQIKKCLEISQRLNAECFLLWPCREGYDNTFQTDVSREIKLFAKLLKLTAEYKDRLNYRCQLLIMPYYNCQLKKYAHNFGWQPHGWREGEVLNRYMWDVTSCLYLLKNFNLDRYYKVCSPPGHHMCMAMVYNMLGGVRLSNAIDHYDSKSFTLMMKGIIDQGTAPPSGICLNLRGRRSGDARDLLTLHVKYIDAAAKGLRFAASIIAEQTFSKHLQQRYITYHSGFGSRLVSSDVTMEECEDFCKKTQNQTSEPSRSEHMDLFFQRYLDTSDRI
ncbi:hypothetical protein evm_007968 [Chilo suppressalis]|nr:hypothetical protein evm_007968 [Chilo suppressalis]